MDIYTEYTTTTAHNLSSALEECLKLREGDPKFWAFRGQRHATWDIGLHHDIASYNNLDTYFEQFQRRCMEFPPHHHMEESNEWRWLFFAQHHRLKTRLLDWTKDPLVAIYFAVENILSRQEDQSECGAVWALHVNDKHFKNPKDFKDIKDINAINDWILINPPPFTPRIARQSGLFSYHPDRDPASLNKIHLRKGEQLVKIKIEAKNGNNPTADIRKQLGILNIHHGSLFPDPDGVAQFINKEWANIGNI